MIARFAPVSIGIYLFACIVLGGSAQGVWGNLALQLVGICLIALVSIAPRNGEQERGEHVPALLLLAGLILILLQLLPLPPGVWAHLPGHAPASAGMERLGYPLPWLPVSMTPFASVTTLFSAIPAIAVFLAVLVLGPDPRIIAMGIVAATFLAIVLGAAQVAGGAHSWAYLYRVTNAGAVGFFANRNHMATLLLVAIPMAALLLSSLKGDSGSSAGRYALAGVSMVLLLVGIALNGSLAVLALVVPVLAASASLFGVGARWRRFVFPASLLALLAGVILLATTQIGDQTPDLGASRSVESRTAIWSTTTSAIANSFPVGTGLGSFEQVYRLYEDPAEVSDSYVNHAHNDYLELALELGAAGMALIAAFLAWWIVTAGRIWASPLSTPSARAGSIAAAAILAHSVVDFPLRTAAISSIFAASLALMAQRLQSGQAQAKTGARARARHLKLG